MAANGNVCRCPAAYLLAGSESERAHARETGTRASEAEQIICYPHRLCCTKILANSLFPLLMQFTRRVDSYRACPDESSGSTRPL